MQIRIDDDGRNKEMPDLNIEKKSDSFTNQSDLSVSIGEKIDLFKKKVWKIEKNH